jgi:predicted amidophosphoribosyltransferase
MVCNCTKLFPKTKGFCDKIFLLQATHKRQSLELAHKEKDFKKMRIFAKMNFFKIL